MLVFNLSMELSERILCIFVNTGPGILGEVYSILWRVFSSAASLHAEKDIWNLVVAHNSTKMPINVSD